MIADPSTPYQVFAYRNLADAVRRMPTGRNGRPTHVATLTRWIVDGVPSRMRPGFRIRMRGLKLPGRWVTTDAWVDEFLEAVTQDRMGEPAPEVRTPAARHRAAERADRELDRLGF